MTGRYEGRTNTYASTGSKLYVHVFFYILDPMCRCCMTWGPCLFKQTLIELQGLASSYMVILSILTKCSHLFRLPAWAPKVRIWVPREMHLDQLCKFRKCHLGHQNKHVKCQFGTQMGSSLKQSTDSGGLLTDATRRGASQALEQIANPRGLHHDATLRGATESTKTTMINPILCRDTVTQTY